MIKIDGDLDPIGPHLAEISNPIVDAFAIDGNIKSLGRMRVVAGVDQVLLEIDAGLAGHLMGCQGAVFSISVPHSGHRSGVARDRTHIPGTIRFFADIRQCAGA